MTATSHAFMCVHECVLGDAPKCTWKQIYRKMTLLLHVQTIYNLTLLCRRSNSRIWRINLFLKGRLGGHTIKCVLSSEHLKKTKLHFWVQKSWGTKTVWGTVLAYDVDEPCCLGRACCCCDCPYSVSSDVSQYFGTCGCDSSPLTHDEGPAVYSVGPAPFPSSPASLSAPFSCPGFIRIWHLPGRNRNRNLAFHSHLQMRPLLLSHLHTLTLSVYTHLGPLSTCSVPLKTQFKCQSEPWN